MMSSEIEHQRAKTNKKLLTILQMLIKN